MDNIGGSSCGTRLTVVFALGIVVAGVIAYGLLRQPSEYEYGQQMLRLETAEALRPWGIAFRIGLGAVLLVALIGLVRVGLRFLDNRAHLIRPTETGQYPIRVLRPGEVLVDPNRLPDGKAVAAVVGGKAGLLLTLFFRYVVGRPLPELTEQPAVFIAPPDTSAEQLAVTEAAQRAQLAAAVFQGAGVRPPAPRRAAHALLAVPGRPVEKRLPPLLVEGGGPREVQLLLAAARQEWRQGEERDEDQDDVVDVVARVV